MKLRKVGENKTQKDLSGCEIRRGKHESECSNVYLVCFVCDACLCIWGSARNAHTAAAADAPARPARNEHKLGDATALAERVARLAGAARGERERGKRKVFVPVRMR